MIEHQTAFSEIVVKGVTTRRTHSQRRWIRKDNYQVVLVRKEQLWRHCLYCLLAILLAAEYLTTWNTIKGQTTNNKNL